MYNELDIRRNLRLGPLLSTLTILLLVYLPALYDLVLDWYTDSNYSHGFLIPLVSGYLLWQKRSLLKATPVRIDGQGLIFVLAGMFLFVLGNGAAEYFTLRFSLIVTLFGIAFYLLGREMIAKIWFELLFLTFMVPIPYVIYYAATFPMQLLASKATAAVLDFIGMAVYRQGNIIHIQGFSLEVAEACSGMRSLVSLLALGALYARMTQKRGVAQVILFLSTIPIAVIGNVFRVLVTSLIAYTATNQVTQEPLHSIMGLLVFAVAFILLFVCGFVLKRIFR
jgi:exosortase